jgi:transcriptional regulator with XRE-family HTH domain
MFSEMKTQERLEARRLRREEGRSVKEIERLLGVSRSTASLWVRDIPLTVAQRASLKRRNPIYNGQFKGAAVNAERGPNTSSRLPRAGATTSDGRGRPLRGRVHALLG